MSRKKTLSAKKQEILDGWFRVTIDSYPADTARFLKSQKDPFANPVGQTTYRSLDALLDILDKGDGREAMAVALDPILRIRAVQTMSPSRATSFVFSLKQVLRRLLPETGSEEGEGGLGALDRKIDEMALAAFDIYVTCREKVFELKASESRNQFFGSLKRAGLIDETEADGPGF
jgi:hypothetical protein